MSSSLGSVEMHPVVQPTPTLPPTVPDRVNERYPKVNENDDENEPVSIFTTLVNFVATLLIPFVLQFLFGGFAVIKTLLCGYFLQSAVHVLSCAEDTVGIPSALLGIAALALVAMLVHPDGLTWIFARSLRDGLSMVVHSSSNIWAVLVTDYGTIISSFLALLTFASLFLVAFAMHRTLASRTPKNQALSAAAVEKQKRKRRKGHGRGKGRIRTHKTFAKDDKVVESRDESETVNLPPVSENKAVISLPLPLPSEKLAIPDCIDSVSSSVDDGGSVSTSESLLFLERPSIVTTNTSPVSPVAELIRNSFERIDEKPETNQSKLLPTQPERILPPKQRNPVPSKRWDALKPTTQPTTSRLNKTWTPPRPKSSNKAKLSKKRNDQTPPATKITSDLNPETPEWIMHNPSTITSTPLRPPPGLHHPKDIPFGCSSTDEDDASSWLLLRQLDVGSLETTTTTTTPTPLFSTTSPYLPIESEPCSQDHDKDDATIEAELQLLGGQMVGSILDF